MVTSEENLKILEKFVKIGVALFFAGAVVFGVIGFGLSNYNPWAAIGMGVTGGLVTVVAAVLMYVRSSDQSNPEENSEPE